MTMLALEMLHGHPPASSQARTCSRLPKVAAICPLRPLQQYFAPRGKCLARCASSASSQTSYFEVLGVSESASPEEVKAAFRAKSKLLHPDVNKEATAARDFMLLRRAYTTLSRAELRDEYEAKLGMPSARARDPRFARFERWRREVIPDLRIQLDVWSRGIDGFIAAWGASLDTREQHLARLYSACVQSLLQLQDAVMAEQRAQQQQQWQQQQQQRFSDTGSEATRLAAVEPPPDWRLPDEDFASLTSAASAGMVPSYVTEHMAAGPGPGAAGSLAACEEALREMEAEVAGFMSDAGDGTARVDREVEKRYQQVSVRYPAYPDIVWMDVWEETSEQWLAQSSAETRRCEEAASRWSDQLHKLREQVQATTQEKFYGQVAGAGTGRFNAG